MAPCAAAEGHRLISCTQARACVRLAAASRQWQQSCALACVRAPQLTLTHAALLPQTQAGLLRVHAQAGAAAASPWAAAAEWRATAGVACMAALPGGARCAVGGDGKDVLLYDVAAGGTELARAKPPPKDWLGMYQKIYVASLAFLGAHAPDAMLAGGEKELRLFDFRAQRRAVRCMPLGQGLVRALAVSADGATACAGTSHGEMASFDLGTGKMLGVMKVRDEH